MVVTPAKNETPNTSAIPQEQLLLHLRGETQPLFALLDSARDPLILKLLIESKEEHQSLYQGAQGEKLLHFAPYLVRLSEDSPLLEKLIKIGWGKSWGIYLACERPFQEVRGHFRHFLMVKTEDGRDLYFRFYDPRVLRVFLPACTPQEADEFFGPIKCYWVEDEKPGSLFKFTNRGRGAQKAALPVTSQEKKDG